MPDLPMDTPADAGTPDDQEPPPQQPWYVRWWPLTLAAGLAVGVVAVVAFGIGMLYLSDYRSATVPAAKEAIQPPTVLLDVNGEEIVKLDPSQVGEQVTSAELPDHVTDAVLAAEDRGFYEHGGFSVRAIAGPDEPAQRRHRAGRVDHPAAVHRPVHPGRGAFLPRQAARGRRRGQGRR